MTLDWPDGFERTDSAERTKNRNFQASLADTTGDLETELDRLDPDKWRAEIGNQHTKSNGLPLHNASPDDPGFVLRWTDDGDEFAVACDAYTRLRDNVRTVYLWVHETRMRGNRPVVTRDDEFAAARLPPGDEDEDVVEGREPPHEVLDVSPDAPDAIVKGAARAMMKRHHPDHGGEREDFERVKDARDALLNGGEPE